MHLNKTGWDRDKIIREALRRELESISPSPSGPVWARIQAGLAQEKKEPAVPFMRRLPWRRLAAAAALLFIFAGAGFALSRSGLLTPPGLLKNDFPQFEASEDGVAEMYSGAEALSPPLTLRGGFALEKARDEGFFQTEDHYSAAVYRRGKESLLWICASSSIDLQEFIAELSRQLGIRVEILDQVIISDPQSRIVDRQTSILEFKTKGYSCEPQTGILEFKTGEHSGIAWQDAGGAQAVLTLSGSPDLRALLPIWDTGDAPVCPTK